MVLANRVADRPNPVNLHPHHIASNQVFRRFEADAHTAAVCTQAAQPQAAAGLIKLLTSPEAAELRRLGGFE